MYRKLDKILKGEDAVLLTSPHNMRYFSGFTGGEGAVLITNKERLLFTDSRYTEQAERETKNFSVVKWCGLGDLCNAINERGIKTAAIEDDCMTVMELKRLKELAEAEFTGRSAEINKLRMVKEEWELERIAKAEEIGDKAFSHILGYIKEGVSERDIAAELEYFMKRQGADKTSFDTIAISGKKTSMPHGRPDNKKLENGDFITMDFGCVFGGYCSDMTRTVVLGKSDKRQKAIYETVLTAQREGLLAIRSGISGADADKAARAVIERAGYGEYFGHSLGHGVGLLIHELPNLSPKSGIILEENMVVSCEPGIYIPGFGGVRIEDLVCVKGGGCLNFTHSEKNLIEI